jgi:hypothetical protein
MVNKIFTKPCWISLLLLIKIDEGLDVVNADPDFWKYTTVEDSEMDLTNAILTMQR